MRQTEVDYWDKQFGNKGIYDNPYKRQMIVSKLLKLSLIGKSVFEIGAGSGLTACAVNTALAGCLNYSGMELSAKSVEKIRSVMDLNVVHGDIVNIPTKEKHDVIWAFDVLEHVRPEDRDRGYCEIKRILKPNGIIALHQPTCETHHDLEFDHGFGIKDLARLCELADCSLMVFENYGITLPKSGEIRYEWIICRKADN